MNSYAKTGVFRVPVDEIEAEKFMEKGRRLVAEAGDELVVNALWHPLTRLGVAQALDAAATAELRHASEWTT